MRDVGPRVKREVREAMPLFGLWFPVLMVVQRHVDSTINDVVT